MEFILNILKKYWYLFLGGLILILIILFQLWMFYYFNNEDVDNNNEIVLLSEEKVNSAEIDVKEEYLYADIKGRVKNPGVYKLVVGSRVSDLISISGGLLDDADTSVTNLSLKLSDEMVVIVYSKDEVNNFRQTKEEESLIISGCLNNNKIENDSCINSSDIKNDETNDKISINSASVDELMQLPGIGESKAKSIIEYRTLNGNFEQLEDLLNVSGIGEKLFEDIKERISL